MLHRTKDMQAETIGATGGVIGHVKDFYFDDTTEIRPSRPHG